MCAVMGRAGVMAPSLAPSLAPNLAPSLAPSPCPQPLPPALEAVSLPCASTPDSGLCGVVSDVY